MSIKIIDCTIRDGGHINNWNFDPQFVRASYQAASEAGVDYFEIGYRFPELKGDIGDFGYCHDDFIKELIEPADICKLMVMVDADKADSGLFKNAVNSPVKIIRVACYPDELEKAIRLSEELKEKGYEIFLHFMTFSKFSDSQFEILQRWENKDILNAAYFADSFGTFTPPDITQYVRQLKDIEFSQIGFHAHNNLQLAFANTLKAMEEGAAYVDASIFGMGRGAGNIPVEALVGFLQKTNNRYNPLPYIEVIEKFYPDIFTNPEWGYNVKTLISGLKNVHPYYIEDLFARDSYTISEIWQTADSIKNNCSTSYSLEMLDKICD